MDEPKGGFMFKKLLIVLVLATGCSSLKDKVLTRMDDLDKRPRWATLSKTMFKKDGKIYSVGFTEALSGARISALARIGDNNARFEIARTIVDETNFIFQNMEEGVEEGGQLSRFYGNEISKYVSHGMRQEERYWEKVRTFDENGEPLIRLRMFSLVSIKEGQLRKAIRDTLQKENGISAEMKRAIDNHITAQITGLYER